MKLKLFLSAVIASAAFAACSSGGEDEPETTTPTNPTPEARVPLTVEVTEQPLINADPSRQADTRTDIATLSTLSKFSMWYYRSTDYNGKYEFEKNGTAWASASNSVKYWPQETISGTIYPFHFHAYTDTRGNISFHGADGPYISVTVEEAAFDQQDVLVAKSIEYTAPKQSAVALTFDHICAAVGLTIRMTDNLSTKLKNSSLYVSQVKLKGLAKKGDYHYDTGWKDVSNETADYTISYSTHRKVTTTRTNMTDTQSKPFYLFLIPQQTTASLEITYQIGDTGGNNTTTIPNISVNWQKGYLYYIDINLGTANITVP